MTGRERLNAILHKRSKDRITWTTWANRVSYSYWPEEMQGDHGMDFYRDVGCDIFHLNGNATPYVLRSPRKVWSQAVEETTRQPDKRTRIVDYRTPWGELTAAFKDNQPQKYLVETIEDVRVYRQMWEGAGVQSERDKETFAELDSLIGDCGVVTRFWGESAIPHLLEFAMGVENFYYLLFDYPDEMEGLINAIHTVQLKIFHDLARTPCNSVTLCENTSTAYISPTVYEKYNMPHQRDFCEAVHANNKVAVLHMCGAVRGLLPLIKETGCDGIHALTPPPTGDCPWEEALDVLGDDLVIIGGLDPSILLLGKTEDIAPTLDEIITPRIRDANFVLSPGCDGIEVPLERLYAIRDWFEVNDDKLQ